MGVFDNLKQAELQEACKLREIPIPAGATNAVLIALLEQFEADQLAEPGGEEGGALPSLAAEALRPNPDVMPAPVFLPSDPKPPGPPPVVVGETAMPAVSPKIFRITYPIPGGLSTDQHEQYRLQAHAAAIAAGYSPRAVGGVGRVGNMLVDGVPHAIYEVPLRRQ